jgi:hypothetical protein
MRWLSVFFGLALAASAGSQARAVEAAVKGLGTQTCARFLEHIRSDSRFEFEYIDWALGFMSGMNFVDLARDRMAPLRNLAAKTPQEQMAYMRDYCAANPEKDYWLGVTHLYRQFPMTEPGAEPPDH